MKCTKRPNDLNIASYLKVSLLVMYCTHESSLINTEKITSLSIFQKR